MKLFPINSTVSITFPLIDYNGDPVTPTGLSYVLRDDEDVELIGPVDVFSSYTAGDTELIIQIAGNFNQDEGPRTVALTITTADSVVMPEEIYAIAPVKRLRFLTNTFQTLASALYLARDLPDTAAWDAATKDAQEGALIEAFGRLTRLNFVIPYPEMVDTQSLLDPDYYAEITPRMWPSMTVSLFARYPVEFVMALRKAQIADANQMLVGDPIGDKIRSGLFSEKVGESSMMFRSGSVPLKLPVARVAMEYLTGYINNRLVLTRL